MPDKSARNVYQVGLKAGRKPSVLPPRVPYRIEEWGKGRRCILPRGRDGPKIAVRGPPSCGTLAIYVGEETKLPPRNPKEAGFSVRVVEKGFAYTEKEARDRLDAYIRRRQLEQMGKARRRARKKSTGSRSPVP
jgi:hypothetical protein